jgi:hypothetical protein
MHGLMNIKFTGMGGFWCHKVMFRDSPYTKPIWGKEERQVRYHLCINLFKDIVRTSHDIAWNSMVISK